jgi:hypothetical protein
MASSILNSDDGVISGTSGLKSSGGDDGTLKIQANGVDAASVTSGQVFSFVNNFGTVANLPAYQCRAWVNFNGTGTVAIRASGNVTSITDNGTGDYTVNFTTALPDANYAGVVTGGRGAAGSGGFVPIAPDFSNPTTTAYRVITTGTAFTTVDTGFVQVAIFR